MIPDRAMPAATVRLRNARSGTNGSATRASTRKNARKDTAAIAKAMRTGTDAAGSPTQLTASTRATIATVKRTAPGTSKLRRPEGSTCGTATRARRRATSPTGTLIQNTHGHPQKSVISPPKSGPRTIATGKAAPMIAR